MLFRRIDRRKPVGASADDSADSKTDIAALKKAGGKFELDAAGNAVGLDFNNVPETDADLAHLAGLHHLQKIGLWGRRD